jgi:DGQHR domain-containing protein
MEPRSCRVIEKLVDGFLLQEQPRIYVCGIPGLWLLKHTTPSWRIEDPVKGFQRIVKEQRATEIAMAVLDQQRTFPNAIVLATDVDRLSTKTGKVRLPGKIRLLVIDGQHRLWAQKHSKHEATYACVVHVGLTEPQMAELFIEINDTQKRVPSSLRWDLVRLVRPEDDPFGIRASELVWELSTEKDSPLFQRVDLTGEQHQIKLKQGSLAPEIKTLISRRKGPLRDAGFDEQYEVLANYFTAIRSLNSDGWRRGTGPFAKARVIRPLLRILDEISLRRGKEVLGYQASKFKQQYLSNISEESLADEKIRAAQGRAGMKEIHAIIYQQVFGNGSQ